MKDTPGFRKWPLAILGLIAVTATLPVVFDGLQPQIRLELRSLPPGVGHWLGTDSLGRDVFMSILTGTQRSMVISVGAALIGGAIGVCFGSLTSFFGDDRLRVTVRSLLAILLALLSFGYVISVLWPATSANGQTSLAFLIVLALLSCITMIWLFLVKRGLLGKSIVFPLDTVTQRFTEVFSVIPRLYLIIAFAMVIPINIVTLIVLFAITSWDVMARMVRAEMLKVREMTFIESARIIGLPESKVFFRHALPNAIGPVATQVCFTMSGLLIAEATLSFVGIGVSPEVVSWGSIIHGYLENLQAWWLALFPGICIYITVISLHALGSDFDRLYNTNQ